MSDNPKLQAAIDGIDFRYFHIPHNKSERVDWSVVYHSKTPIQFSFTILINDQTFEYHAGVGHHPAYRHTSDRNKQYRTGTIVAKALMSDRLPFKLSLLDVLYCLVLDAEAMDYTSFEEWADTYGYDTDSRSAEAIFNACRVNGQKLRSAIGVAKIEELRELFQDY